jgi:hypothetical protein
MLKSERAAVRRDEKSKLVKSKRVAARRDTASAGNSGFCPALVM